MARSVSMAALHLLWLFVVSSWAQKAPSITYISPDVVVDTGEEALLTCRISEAQEYPILWMRLGSSSSSDSSGDTPMSVGSNLLAMDQQRLSLEHDASTGSYALRISDVQLSDEATYQCQVLVALNRKLTRDVRLQIRKPPSIDSERSTSSVRATFGSDAKLQCLASGFPMPMVQWRRGNGALFADGSEHVKKTELKLTNLRMEDAGDYVCMASNEVGDDVEHVARLDVEFAPIIEVIAPRVPQAEEYDAKLECRIRALPSPTIVWKHENGENVDVVNQPDKFVVDNFADEDHLVLSTLLVMSVGSNEYGNYTCNAGNRHGSASETVELYESKKPICPPVCGDVDLDNKADSNRFGNLSFVLIAGLVVEILRH